MSVAAIVSTIVAVTLAVSYLANVRATVTRFRPTRGVPPVQRDVTLKAHSGRLVCYVERTTTVPGPGVTITAAPGTHFRWSVRAGDFELRRAIWDFDAHVLSVTPTSRIDIYAAPTWCFEVPCLVAPAAWLWRRRRQQRLARPAGFAVVPTS